MTRRTGHAHPRLALFTLALGGFAIGVTEFTAMGLLPDIAHALLPALWAQSSERADAQAGLLVTAYAAGVVVGAPTIAAFAAKLPHRGVLLALVGSIVVTTVLTAVLPSFGLVLVARFLSGLPHGAYFGVASLVAAEVLGPGSRGKAAAWVLSGLTIANVIGVPAITAIGQHGGWRLAFLVVAGVFAATFVAIRLAVPHLPADPGGRVRTELRAFTKPLVWLTIAMGAIGFGGFFAAYTYIAPITTQLAGLPASAVPIVLVVIGVGMTVGNAVGGIVIDRGVARAMVVFFAAVLVSLVWLGLTASWVPGLLTGALLIGATASALGPAIQVRLQDVAHESRTIAPALNHSALNLGNALGAGLGATVITLGAGYLAPIWLGVAMTAAGILLALVSLRWQAGEHGVAAEASG